jgi:signal transduction histidine kinase
VCVPDVRAGLTRRTVVASALLAVLVGAAFAVLVQAVAEEREAADQAIDSLEVIAAATALERLVLDLETGQRGFLVTDQERFLEPWQSARDRYRRTADTLIRRSGRANGQATAAREIVTAVDAYVTEYSVPLVAAARRGEPSAGGAPALDEGKRRVDALRAQFARFLDGERQQYAARHESADSDARRAIVVAGVGLAGSTLLIVLFGGYLTRAVALPVRRASVMAGRLAGGDLSTRMPETGTGEVGTLERAFNTMAGSLEESRGELVASRARVVATADETRRRLERDLHDGAQQSLVHTVITLKLARRALGDASGPEVELIDEALSHAERANDELRELAHGILPATLSRGLGAAIETLASRMRLPVSMDVTEERLTPELEATAYFIVAEALTNTVKHARASRAHVSAAVADGVLHVEVRDDGVGGAGADGRSGLLGLSDRVAAVNGDLHVNSPPGGGTTIVATLPVDGGYTRAS